MESLAKNNAVLKFTDNNMVEISFDTEQGKQIKNVTFNDLVDAMIAARMNIKTGGLNFIDSPILTHNVDNGIATIRTREFENDSKHVVIMQKPIKTDIEYFGTIFKNVGVPRLLYAVHITKNVVSNVKIVAVKDRIVTSDTILYSFPFSNVNPTSGNVCFGVNRITKIDFASLLDLHSIPSMFHAMPSNNDNYGHNLSGLQHRPLLEALVDKDFNEEWLKPSGYTFEQWFNTLA